VDQLGALSLFAQQNNAGGAAGLLGSLACCFGVFGGMFLLIFLIMWKIYSKAGQPGWTALIPIYNQWILVTEICKKEPLWFVLMLLPVANIVAAWVVSMELAKKFGKSETFGIGLFFLAPIFLAILAFGDAEYQGGRNSKKRSRARDDDEDEDY
jgi:hypothetical protein